jgi:ABC-type arginine transport system permease subunit
VITPTEKLIAITALREETEEEEEEASPLDMYFCFFFLSLFLFLSVCVLSSCGATKKEAIFHENPKHLFFCFVTIVRGTDTTNLL